MAKPREMIGRPYRMLFQAFRDAVTSPPSDLIAAIHSLPLVGTLPSPWETWLLISLFAYRRRQDWARNQVRRQCRSAAAAWSKPGHPRDTVLTFLPKDPVWEVEIWSDGPQVLARLQHRVTGEAIVTDVTDGKRRTQTVLEDLGSHVDSESRLEPAARLQELCIQGVNVDPYAQDCLLRNHVIDVDYEVDESAPEFAEIRHRLSKYSVQREKSVHRFCRVWQGTGNRLWIAALIGDWPLAAELAKELDNVHLLEITSMRAHDCREQRLKCIQWSLLNSRTCCTDDLKALSALEAPNLGTHVQRGLTDHEDCSAVAGFLQDCDDPRWCSDVYNYLASPDVQPTQSRYWRSPKLVKYLLRNGHRCEDALHLLASKYCQPDKAAKLALKSAPPLVLPFIRAALRSTDEMIDDDSLDAVFMPHPMLFTVLLLAEIDMPWCRRELLSALSELAPQRWANRIRALPCVLALAESCDKVTRDAIITWRELYDQDEYEHLQELFREMCDSGVHLNDTVVAGLEFDSAS